MLILASASPRRQELLKRIGVLPDKIHPADIDETELVREMPRKYCERVAIEKARAIAQIYPNDFILSADTVVSIGRRILPKAESLEQAKLCLELLSGKNHIVTTVVALIKDNRLSYKTVLTRIKFKKLSDLEIANYLASNEWQAKAGGYGIQGLAGAFIMHLSGSWEGVMGLPLYETRSLLIGNGYAV